MMRIFSFSSNGMGHGSVSDARVEDTHRIGLLPDTALIKPLDCKQRMAGLPSADG